MNLKYVVVAFTVLLVVSVEGRKTSRGRSSGASGRGSSRKTNYNPQPAPTSFSSPQASAPKPSLSGWQERPAQKSNTQTLSSWQSKPSSGQSHSYPSSNTGLSGDRPKQPANNQESIQRSSASNNFGQQQTNNQPSHSYPSSNGLSGTAGSGSGYPQQNANKYPQQQGSSLSGTGSQSGYPQSPGSGLSGNAQAGGTYPQQHGYGAAGSAAAPPPYSAAGQSHYPAAAPPSYSAAGQSHYPAAAPPPYQGHSGGYNNQHNYGNNYQHQGPPPPYSNNNYGSSYGGFGGHGLYNPGPQSPGYFGNYNKGYGGVSRTGSALTGVGIAGAGIGTVLTGLALWNLARSTGRSHHTVIYDNRGQPVAVAPGNDTSAPAADSILADLVNCSLTISNDDKTEVLAIPCSIATSFTPEADVKESGINQNAADNTKCTITVLTKAMKEFMTTIPCSILLNTAAENNVTEPPLVENGSEMMNNYTSSNNSTEIQNSTLTSDVTPLNEPTALRLSGGDLIDPVANLNCTPHSGEIRDPINPCYAVNHNLTVIPLSVTDAPI
ncbi:unnamed protein product [Chrysodeixis includens]|uniref:Uncharacterized protein n=1 Tax=Chrysodeixis includens TaxID=689277 RepID=A0A9P0BZE6_CHRIL|nr:unnamed protein product [Chrysodeixis includens]